MTAAQKKILALFPVGEWVSRNQVEEKYKQANGNHNGSLVTFNKPFFWLLKNRLLDLSDDFPQRVRRRTPQEIADYLTHQIGETGRVK